MNGLNYEVYYRTLGGRELLRAAFVTRYEAEKYVEEWHSSDRPQWFIRVLNDHLVTRIEWLD